VRAGVLGVTDSVTLVASLHKLDVKRNGEN